MQIGRSEIAGIILAGGKSKRMGVDKAMLTRCGKPLIAHVIDALEMVTDTIIIISSNSALDQFGKPRYPDFLENAGPLAGLYTGLQHSSTRFNFVLGCDTPLVNKTLFDVLLENSDPEVEVVQLACRETTMPLIALYQKSCMARLLSLIESGERRLRESVASLNPKTLQLDQALEKYTLNMNRPEDLARFQQLHV